MNKFQLKRTNFLADLDEFPLKSLANLAIYSRENDDSIYPYTFCADGTSHILKYLAQSRTLQDVHYVTVYLHNLYLLLSREIMVEHKMKVKDLMDGIDPKTSHKEIFTVMSLHYACFLWAPILFRKNYHCYYCCLYFFTAVKFLSEQHAIQKYAYNSQSFIVNDK